MKKKFSRRDFLKLALSGIGVFLASCLPRGLRNPTPASTAVQTTPANPTGSPQAVLNGEAEVIFSGGTILTMDAANTIGEAIALKGNQILAVGTNEQVQKQRGTNTQLIDLQGRTLMPGFIDAHNHMGQSAQGDAAKFQQLQDEALRGGITTTTEMYVDPTVLDQLKGFDQSGLMSLRWNVYLLYNTNCGDPVDPNWYKTYKQGEQISAHIRNQGVKVFSDGGSCHVPAVSFEYPNGNGHGDLFMTPDQLSTAVQEIQNAGYQVAIHALGDRAVEESQNAIAGALNGTPNTFRHRIEHNAVLHDTLLPRYDQIGILPVIFGAYPTCWRDNPSSQFKYAVPTDLGTWEWPWRLLLDANPGIKAAWHSDYPYVGSTRAMDHLYGYVTRNQVAADGSICQAPDWLKQGAITVDEALHIMTIHSAYALFREKEIGSLETGKLADLVILSDNPTKVQPEAIKDINVLMAMVDGKAAFCAAGFESFCPSSVPAAASPTQADAQAIGGITATASAAMPDHPPSAAIDGSADTWWSAGDGPVQWIQLDLGQPQTVSGIRLTISQYPDGETDHQVWAGPDPDSLQLVAELSGYTRDPDVLTWLPPSPLANIRIIKVVTVKSPSWVAWREIEVMG
jgi:predicted amidohydrolase YtcJ